MDRVRPKNLSEADALARKYAGGELPLPQVPTHMLILEEDPEDEPPDPRDVAERYSGILDRIEREAPDSPGVE